MDINEESRDWISSIIEKWYDSYRDDEQAEHCPSTTETDVDFIMVPVSSSDNYIDAVVEALLDNGSSSAHLTGDAVEKSVTIEYIEGDEESIRKAVTEALEGNMAPEDTDTYDGTESDSTPGDLYKDIEDFLDSDSKVRRFRTLSSAAQLVNGDRNNQYGDPIDDFKRTAAMWSTYVNSLPREDLLPHDVAVMQILLKISRISWSPEKEDSWVDIAGYAACGWDCAAQTVVEGE